MFVNQSVSNGEIAKIDAHGPGGAVVSGGGFGVGANQIVYADTIDAHTFEVAAANFSTFL